MLSFHPTRTALGNALLAAMICCGSGKAPAHGSIKVASQAALTSSLPICYSAELTVFTVGAGQLTPFVSQTFTAGAEDDGVLQAILPCQAPAGDSGSLPTIVQMTLSTPPDNCQSPPVPYDVLEMPLLPNGSWTPVTATSGVIQCNAAATGIEANAGVNLVLHVVTSSTGDVDVTAQVTIDDDQFSYKRAECKPFLLDANGNAVNCFMDGIALWQQAGVYTPMAAFDLRTLVDGAGNPVGRSPEPAQAWNIHNPASFLQSYTQSIATVPSTQMRTWLAYVTPVTASGPLAPQSCIASVPASQSDISVDANDSCGAGATTTLVASTVGFNRAAFDPTSTAGLAYVASVTADDSPKLQLVTAQQAQTGLPLFNTDITSLDLPGSIESILDCSDLLTDPEGLAIGLSLFSSASGYSYQLGTYAPGQGWTFNEAGSEVLSCLGCGYSSDP